MQRKAEGIRVAGPAWQAYYDGVCVAGKAVRALDRARVASGECAEVVYRLHRVAGPQTATRLQELEVAWQAWDAATAVVIEAEAAAAAAVAAMPARPSGSRPSRGWVAAR